jgi:hypothetical protein
MLCRHCGRVRASRPRGLCWSCYYTQGVRELFPSTSKFARRGVDDFNGKVPLPPAPTGPCRVRPRRSQSWNNVRAGGKHCGTRWTGP